MLHQLRSHAIKYISGEICKTMKLEEFRELSISHRASILHEEGKFLAKRNSQTFQVDLYKVHSFYVEIWNNTIHGILMDISAFDDDIFLKPYLDEFSISELAN